ncbi:MAG: hypothetical protein ACYCOU_01155 [Sulfobacillus sp.]
MNGTPEYHPGSRDTAPAERGTPLPDRAGATGPAERMVLTVSPALQALAVAQGRVLQDGALVLTLERYGVAARYLTNAWSRFVPVALATDRALGAGVAPPATLTAEALDALLVHDHECLAARDRLLAKERRQANERGHGERSSIEPAVPEPAPGNAPGWEPEWPGR